MLLEEAAVEATRLGQSMEDCTQKYDMLFARFERAKNIADYHCSAGGC